MASTKKTIIAAVLVIPGALAGFVLGRTSRKVTLKELRKHVAELQLVAA